MRKVQNKYDCWIWVLKVIESAKTKGQRMSACNLIRNWQRQFITDINDPMDMEADMISFRLSTRK